MKKTKGNEPDIIQLILDDHKPLKKLIKIMKDSEKYDLKERKAAFEEFAPLLVRHAKPEEETWYIYMKDKEEMREEGLEGDVEHQLADQMIEEAKRAEDDDLFSARIKVLAELVEHHIKEEEEEQIPDFKKNSEPEERVALADAYLEIKSNIRESGAEIDPAKKPVEIQANH